MKRDRLRLLFVCGHIRALLAGGSMSWEGLVAKMATAGYGETVTEFAMGAWIVGDVTGSDVGYPGHTVRQLRCEPLYQYVTVQS